ncbi:MAG: hypothetical protein IJV91_00375 [Kiritimatiellae bacterium]|nr:hypothetical protein [Kiritimatiellia bacterium]
MLHGSIDVLLKALAGFEFLPNEGQQTVPVDFKDFLHGKVLLLDSEAIAPAGFPRHRGSGTAGGVSAGNPPGHHQAGSIPVAVLEVAPYFISKLSQVKAAVRDGSPVDSKEIQHSDNAGAVILEFLRGIMDGFQMLADTFGRGVAREKFHCLFSCFCAGKMKFKEFPESFGTDGQVGLLIQVSILIHNGSPLDSKAFSGRYEAP